MSQTLKACVIEIRGHGFWCRATETRLNQMIDKLRGSGLSDEVICEVIRDMWLMVSAEYNE
jgi:hypothetical protein